LKTEVALLVDLEFIFLIRLRAVRVENIDAVRGRVMVGVASFSLGGAAAVFIELDHLLIVLEGRRH